MDVRLRANVWKSDFVPVRQPPLRGREGGRSEREGETKGEMK